MVLRKNVIQDTIKHIAVLLYITNTHKGKPIYFSQGDVKTMKISSIKFEITFKWDVVYMTTARLSSEQDGWLYLLCKNCFC